MRSMTMTCVCTEEVSSIVLIPSTNSVIFNVSTHRVLDDGTELSSDISKTETVALTAEVLAAVLALNVAPMAV